MGLTTVQRYPTACDADAAYHYRRSSVVCQSLCHYVSPVEVTVLIEMPLWVVDSACRKEPCIRWGSNPLSDYFDYLLLLLLLL